MFTVSIRHVLARVRKSLQAVGLIEPLHVAGTTIHLNEVSYVDDCLVPVFGPHDILILMQKVVHIICVEFHKSRLVPNFSKGKTEVMLFLRDQAPRLQDAQYPRLK